MELVGCACGNVWARVYSPPKSGTPYSHILLVPYSCSQLENLDGGVYQRLPLHARLPVPLAGISCNVVKVVVGWRASCAPPEGSAVAVFVGKIPEARAFGCQKAESPPFVMKVQNEGEGGELVDVGVGGWVRLAHFLEKPGYEPQSVVYMEVECHCRVVSKHGKHGEVCVDVKPQRAQRCAVDK